MSDTPAWFAFGISAVSLGVAGWGFLRQNAAAERSAKASERSADAAEQSAITAQQVATRRDVRWTLRHRDKSPIYLVVNEGRDSAHVVQVLSPDDRSVGRSVVTPNSAIELMYATDFGKRPAKPVRVSWQDDQDADSPRHHWEWPIG
jgi:hypothetical protein